MTDVNPRQDFYDVMTDYLRRAAADGVVRAEIFFDPQTHCFTDVSGVTALGAGSRPLSTTLDVWRSSALVVGSSRISSSARRSSGASPVSDFETILSSFCCWCLLRCSTSRGSGRRRSLS